MALKGIASQIPFTPVTDSRVIWPKLAGSISAPSMPPLFRDTGPNFPPSTYSRSWPESTASAVHAGVQRCESPISTRSQPAEQTSLHFR